MAKIALCGYGHDGRGMGNSFYGYAYVVNDNVNVGDVLQVVATSSKGRKFVTTASPHETMRENTAEAQKFKTTIQEDTHDGEINQVYSGKELGVKGFRGSEQYQQETRARQMQAYVQEHPNVELSQNASNLVADYGAKDGVNPPNRYQSFDEYSKPYMNGGDK